MRTTVKKSIRNVYCFTFILLAWQIKLPKKTGIYPLFQKLGGNIIRKIKIVLQGLQKYYIERTEETK